MTAYVLAVDVGGTKVDAALVDADGRIVEGSRYRLPTGRALTPETMQRTLDENLALTLAALPSSDVLLGIGVGSAGPIDRATGTITPVNMPGLRGFRLAEACQTAAARAGHTVPAVLGHDGGCLALAESWQGATKDVTSSLSFVVSTGVGGGYVHRGTLVTGASGNTGHLGQMHAGDITLEDTVSGPATIAWARSQGWVGDTGMALAASAAAGDAVARAAIERSATALGHGLADITTLLDLDVISIGGGFSRVSEDYVDLVASAMREHAVLEFARHTRVVRSALGDDGPLIGAAALIFRA